MADPVGTSKVEKRTRKQKTAKHRGPENTAPERRLPWSNLVFLLTALLIFMISSLIAFTQKPRPNPYSPPPDVLSSDWWRYPIERNAFRRLPVIKSNLNDLFVLPDGKHIWAVGDRGLIVHSRDSGESWEQQGIVDEDSTLAQGRNTGISSGFMRNAAAGDLSSKRLVKKLSKTRDTSVQTKVELMSRKGEPSVANAGQKDPASTSPAATKDAPPAITEGKNGVKVPQAILATRANLRAVFIIDEQHGWVVGDDGTILSTSDGGKSWRTQESSTKHSLYAVQFLANGKRGWAVGRNGNVIVTSDGGKTWQSQISGVRNILLAVQFLSDGKRGWAVGSDGAVLATSDGGTTWRKQVSGVQKRLLSVQFLPDGERGWAVGDVGTILVTRDGGKTWQSQVSGTQNYLYAVSVRSDGERGWTVGEFGTILVTKDGGKAWRPQAIGTQIPLSDVDFLQDGEHGWAVGMDGAILATGDGGETWRYQNSRTQRSLSAVQFLPNGKQGWVVGAQGAILATANGGNTWHSQTSAIRNWLQGLQFLPDGERGWAVGRGGAILTTVDGGKTWQSQSSGINQHIRSVQFLPDGERGWTGGLSMLATTDGGNTWQRFSDTQTASFSVQFLSDGKRGWMVGLEGAILVTGDGGKTWQPQVSGTQNHLIAVQILPDGERGWAVGDGGTILVTANGGKTWQSRPSGTQSTLYAVQFLPDGKQGWTVGDAGAILSTANGGETWVDPVLPHKLYPGPWYYLSLLFVAALLVPALKRPPAELAPQASVADMMVSDRPLKKGEHDPLGFAAVAAGLSRFLRNANTQPPLTIAITGEWGTGKSSLMNLLKGDLRERGFRPVWFNAWHHQKEDHMLASLLENIRGQAFPPFWTLTGMNFRLRLLRLRRWRVWAPLLITLLIFALCVGYLAHPNSRDLSWDQALERVESLWQGDNATDNGQAPPEQSSHKTRGYNTAETQDRTQSGSGSPLPQDTPAIGQRDLTAPEGAPAEQEGIAGLLSSIAGVLITLFMLFRGGLKGFKAFGVNPIALITSVSGMRAKDLKARTSFRYQFASEFEVVTEALKPHTMTLLIDDLDRCRPENVLEILETVNFLTSSGDCYIVLGMARDRIERCVGLGFKDVAEEVHDLNDKASNANDTQPDNGRRKRAEFARHYLEKLINIEVPVPKLDQERSGDLFKPGEAAQPQTPWECLRDEVAGHSKRLLPWLLFFLVGLAGLIGGNWIADNDGKGSVEGAPMATKNPVPGAGKTASESAPPVPEENATVPETSPESNKAAQLINPKSEGHAQIGFAIVLFFGLIALGIRILLRRPDVIEHDSQEFTDALNVWHPLVFSKRNTPRSIKRFLNRVRYFAMAQRGQEGLAESSLVALSAIHHCDPGWLQESPIFSSPETIRARLAGHPLRVENRDSDEREEHVIAAVKAHYAAFEVWPPSDKEREFFVSLSDGIRVH